MSSRSCLLLCSTEIVEYEKKSEVKFGLQKFLGIEAISRRYRGADISIGGVLMMLIVCVGGVVSMCRWC